MTRPSRLPWSGDVSQWINPMTSWFTGNTSSLVSVNYASSNPDMEAKIVRDVASYGRQLGKMMETLEILTRLPQVTAALDEKQKAAMDDFNTLAREICEAKEKMLMDELSPFSLRSLLNQIKELEESNPELYTKVTGEIRDSLFPSPTKK